MARPPRNSRLFPRQQVPQDGVRQSVSETPRGNLVEGMQWLPGVYTNRSLRLVPQRGKLPRDAWPKAPQVRMSCLRPKHRARQTPGTSGSSRPRVKPSCLDFPWAAPAAEKPDTGQPAHRQRAKPWRIRSRTISRSASAPTQSRVVSRKESSASVPCDRRFAGAAPGCRSGAAADAGWRARPARGRRWRPHGRKAGELSRACPPS